MEHSDVDPEQRARLLERLGEATQVMSAASPSGLLKESSEQSIEYLRQALSIYMRIGLEERSAKVHAAIGTTLLVGGHSRQADDHLKAAETILNRGPANKSLGYAYVAISGALRALGATRDALAASEKAMEIGEHAANQHLWAHGANAKAECLIDCGKLSDAFALLDRALAVSETADPRLGYWVATIGARCYAKLGDPRSAISWVLRELEKPRSGRSSLARFGLLGYLTRYYLSSGELQRAREALPQAATLREGFELASGKWELARQRCAENLAESRPAGAWLREDLRTLGYVQTILGDCVEAQALLREALAISPEGPQFEHEMTIRPAWRSSKPTRAD